MRKLLCLLALAPLVVVAQPFRSSPPFSFVDTAANIVAKNCRVGQAPSFATDATAGANLYLCTATNVWTQAGGAGGPPTGAAGGGLSGTYPNPTLRDFVSVKDAAFGAKGDTQEVTDATLSNGASIVTSASGLFVSGDVGKSCVITSFTGQVLNWQGDCTITGFTNSTTITVSITANATYTGATFDWGTDDTTPIISAWNSLTSGGTVYIPPGRYMTRFQNPTPAPSQGNVTLRGLNRYASVIVGGHNNYMFQPSGNAMTGLDVEDLGFDGLNSASAFLGQGATMVSPTFNNCRFYRVNLVISATMNRGSITNSIIESPGTNRGAGVSISGGSKGFRFSNNICRFTSNCIDVGSQTVAQVTEDVEISNNKFDGGWFINRTAYTGSGGTVTYTATALTDTAANFPTLTANSVIRVLAVRATGTASSLGGSTMQLVDAGATFVTSGVLRGDLIYTGTAVAMVDAVQNETNLVVDEWLDLTTRLPVAPAAGAYTIYKLVFGRYSVSGSSATVLNTTDQKWFDFYGNTVTPAAGTLYEVGMGHGNYNIQIEASVRRSRIANNSVKRGWSDNISLYGSDITVIGNDVVDGQDEGITVNGDHHIISGNHIFHQGTSGIFAACTQCVITGNNISYSSYTNVGNTTSLGDITICCGQTTATDMVISGNVLDGGSNAAPWNTTIHRYGVVARAAGGGFNISAVTITGNRMLNHTVADIQLDGGGGGTVSGITVYGNSGTISAISGAAYSTSSTELGLTANKPAVCAVGSLYFATDATAGQNIYECGSANVWTQQVIGSGTVTQVSTTSPITGGPFTTTGTIACATCGVTGSPLSQFAATTSAQLAGVLSDETGTGSSVFSISPAFTGTPTAPTASQNDNSTKLSTTAYTDLAVSNAIAAVNPAVAALAASTATITGTYANGASGIGATFTVTATGAFTLDGIAINTIGQRVLLKNQTSGFQNGVYTATIVGTTGVSPVFTRALDFDQPSDINSTGAVPVYSGTVNAQTQWAITSSVTTVGTDAITFTQFSINPTTVATCTGDLGGTAPGCTVTATHLAAPLPVSQGGTGTTGPTIITSASGASDVLCAKGADSTVFLSKVLNSVTVTTGTDTSLPNSGTWTTTGGGGTGASGTFTATSGNLATVTITNGGSGYTSNPTFVPNSGTMGTSTTAFSSCVNTSDGTSTTSFQLSWTQAANFWVSGTTVVNLHLGMSLTTSSSPPNVNLVQLIEDASPTLFSTRTAAGVTASASNWGFSGDFTLIAIGANLLEADPFLLGIPGTSFTAVANGTGQPASVTFSGSRVLHPQWAWSANTAGNAVWLHNIVVR